MRHIILTEIKSSICNLRFLSGILLLLAVVLVSERVHLQFLDNLDVSREGPGWFMAYTFCSNGVNTLLFIPIAVTFAAGGNAETEIRSRFSLFSYIRTGKKGYFIGKAAGLALSGGMMVILTMGIILTISIIEYSDIPIIEGLEVDTAILCVEVAVSFLRLFLNGCLWAIVGGLAAVLTKNSYMAYAVPFILYYVFTVFQERYYQKLFFLSPRYWVVPIYSENLFCIGVLLVLSSLTAVLFMAAIKRRLEHV